MINRAGIYTIEVNKTGEIVSVKLNGEEGKPMDYDELPKDLWPGPNPLGGIYFHPAGRCQKLPGCGWR